MDHELRVLDDDEALAAAGAQYVAELARRVVAERGAFHLAVSGGRTPQRMFVALTELDVPWAATTIYQVDERIAPVDDPDRNLAHLRAALAGAPAGMVPMPVEDVDVTAEAQRYAEVLPDRFDLVHLGLGPDGHTASLVPGDPVLEVADRDVAVTSHEYQGRRRMTLTYPRLARSAQLLWLVAGSSKAAPLAQLLSGTGDIPAVRVTADASLVMSDRSAAVVVGSDGPR